MNRFFVAVSLLTFSLLAHSQANAHFLWLVTDSEQPGKVNLYFGESAADDNPDLLERVASAKANAIRGFGRRQEVTNLKFELKDDLLVATLPEKSSNSTIVLNHTYGVISRGGKTFLLKFYAKTSPNFLPGSWRKVSDEKLLPLEIVPQLDGSMISFQVNWKGAASGGATVSIEGPGLEEKLEGTTDENGIFKCKLPAAGLYSIRARVIGETSGEHKGEKYESVRHYSTLSLHFQPSQLESIAHNWPVLPKATTSFGGAVVGDILYVYGGHYGGAHHYSREGQSGDFRALNLKSPAKWEDFSGGPKLTGLALVAHNDKLYRVGGFTAKNGDDEEQSLWSQDSFARFDPKSKKWKSLPSLPEPRSSLDAAAVGDKLYVVGGWQMQGDGETQWHETAWSIDLVADKLEWKPIASPPFKRRALALAAWNEKLYVLGGMQEQGGPTTKVAVFDPKTNQWSKGPNLLGTVMDGFGCSSFACDGRLYVTTMSGSIQRLSENGKTWEYTGQLSHPRFFHRLLPLHSKEFVIVGGASMMTGKINELERLQVVKE